MTVSNGKERQERGFDSAQWNHDGDLTQLNEMMMGYLGGEPFAPASQSIASRSDRRTVAPTGICVGCKFCSQWRSNVGAGLLAMAILQAMNNYLTYSGNS
ncbi:hypothetical protein ACN1C3_15160 [Pseudomonas sp. H11T01]|uniref:hypothetical protein n=1 Tax=Pseudomonas sp. H11T01 TaxID=3402749 RepID=UPI003AC1A666